MLTLSERWVVFLKENSLKFLLDFPEGFQEILSTYELTECIQEETTINWSELIGEEREKDDIITSYYFVLSFNIPNQKQVEFVIGESDLTVRDKEWTGIEVLLNGDFKNYYGLDDVNSEYMQRRLMEFASRIVSK